MSPFLVLLEMHYSFWNTFWQVACGSYSVQSNEQVSEDAEGVHNDNDNIVKLKCMSNASSDESYGDTIQSSHVVTHFDFATKRKL